MYIYYLFGGGFGSEHYCCRISVPEANRPVVLPAGKLNMTRSMLLVGINATLTLLIILRMSWVISFFLSLSELDSLTCFSAIVQLSFSLFPFHSLTPSLLSIPLLPLFLILSFAFPPSTNTLTASPP